MNGFIVIAITRKKPVLYTHRTYMALSFQSFLPKLKYFRFQDSPVPLKPHLSRQRTPDICLLLLICVLEGNIHLYRPRLNPYSFLQFLPMHKTSSRFLAHTFGDDVPCDSFGPHPEKCCVLLWCPRIRFEREFK